MPKDNARKHGSALVLLFAVTYMVSYITRINYGAIISEMVSDTGFPKSTLSLSLTGLFITYGAGQIVSGFFGDRISPKKLISLGLLVSAMMNCLVPVCSKNATLIIICWCINGFAQAFMWPPLVRLMTANFEGEAYVGATVKVSWGSSIGTIVVYLVSPLLIGFVGWKGVFFFSASCAVIMLVLWNIFCPECDPKATPIVPKAKTDESPDKKRSLSVLFNPMMILIMLAIILQGMLRDGVTDWTPSLIAEVHEVNTESAILSSVILPIFSIICFQITSFVHRKWLKNPVFCAGVIFALGAVAAAALYFLYQNGMILTVVLLAVLTATMHGVNLMLICLLPQYFQKYGAVSTVSGVLNSCTYIGSAASVYGFALLSEGKGWNFTIGLWFFIALLGTALCFICARRWKAKMGE